MCEITSSTVGGNQWVFHTLAGEENGSPLQYSCLENPVDGGGWWAAVWGCTESVMTEVTQHACMHWRRKQQPTPVFLPGESQGQRSLVGCHLRGRTELDTTEATQQQQPHSLFTQLIPSVSVLRPELCEVLLKWHLLMMVVACPAWSRQLVNNRETLSRYSGSGTDVIQK